MIDADHSLDLAQAFPLLMRPAGMGLPVVSAGSSAQTEIVQLIYGSTDPLAIDQAWRQSWIHLDRWADKAPIVLLGVPLDTGAGMRRGAASGPRFLREGLYRDPTFLKWLKQGRVLDLGDIFVNPHLLHDEMLSEEQKSLCREGMYPQAGKDLRRKLPVAALSQLEWVLKRLLDEHPLVRPLVLGGDHSVAWPMSLALHQVYKQKMAILQPDAHTDLLSTRFGVKYCYGTWSYHANELLGRGGKLVQLGIRQSGKDKRHWESTLGVKQFWAQDIVGREATALDEVLDHLKKIGIQKVYFSNDIDGTSEEFGGATGTPVSQGVSPDFFLNLLERVSASFEVVGADLVEVAPDLARDEEDRVRTRALGVQYLLKTMQAMGVEKGI